MRKIIRYTLIFTFSLFTANLLTQNFIFQEPVATPIKVAFILAIFEIFLKPVVKLLLLPINLITLGLFRSLINTLGLYLGLFLLADFSLKDVNFTGLTWQGFSLPPFHYNGFVSVYISSLAVSFIFYFFRLMLKNK